MLTPTSIFSSSPGQNSIPFSVHTEGNEQESKESIFHPEFNVKAEGSCPLCNYEFKANQDVIDRVICCTVALHRGCLMHYQLNSDGDKVDRRNNKCYKCDIAIVSSKHSEDRKKAGEKAKEAYRNAVQKDWERQQKARAST